MGQTTSIPWCDATWNPIRGCSMAKGSETGGWRVPTRWCSLTDMKNRIGLNLSWRIARAETWQNGPKTYECGSFRYE